MARKKIRPAYILIIRATTMRGEPQRLALAELKESGLWLSDEQKQQAGLVA